MKILKKSFEEVENITSREEIEKYRNQVIPVKGDENWEKYAKEKYPNRKISKDYKRMFKFNTVVFFLLNFLGIIMYFLSRALKNKENNNIFFSSAYLITSISILIIFIYSLYIFLLEIYNFKNYKLPYSWLVHDVSIYMILLLILWNLICISFMYMAGSFIEFMIFIIFLIWGIIYFIITCINEIKEIKENKINFSKYTTNMLKYGGIILIINSLLIKKLPNEDTISVFIVTGMLMLMFLDAAVPRLKAYIYGCYLKKYSEEFRKKFGYSVEEWYGEKSKFTRKYKKYNKI